MPVVLPVTHNPGDVLTSSGWNLQLRDSITKLLGTGHRVLTVAQFAALTGLEGTKGTVAPDEVYLEVDSTNGIQWHLAYESGETTYKWRFLGGPAMYSEVAATEAITNAAYVALTTAGPSIAVPRAGDFDVQTGCNSWASGAGASAVMSYDIGGTGAVDADSVQVGEATGQVGGGGSVYRLRRKAALTAVTLTAKYRATSGQGNWEKRWMAVTPVRLI